MKSNHILLIMLFLLATPLWMRVAWEFTPEKRLNLLIVDKTVINKNSIKHRSVNWILDHEKYTGSFGGFYNINRDYFGFFPGENEKYTVRDFERYDDSELDSISSIYDLAYFTDTYGILGNDWYRHRDIYEHSASIYGGLSEKDLSLMMKFKRKNKPIIAEYNTIGYPTPHDVRMRFQDTFQVEWTGWVARYIASLDTLHNPDLPKWIVREYRKQFKRGWYFKRDGIIFFNEDGRVIILENGRHLNNPLPEIITNKKAQLRFHLPQQMIYPFWIDIIANKNDSNEVLAQYSLGTTKEGTQLLKENNIPTKFPAIIYREKPYMFYYFCGDFADNPTKFRFAKLEGITALKFLMYNAVDKTDRNRFFWEYYMPMIQQILNEAYQRRNSSQ